MHDRLEIARSQAAGAVRRSVDWGSCGTSWIREPSGRAIRLAEGVSRARLMPMSGGAAPTRSGCQILLNVDLEVFGREHALDPLGLGHRVPGLPAFLRLDTTVRVN